MFSKLFYPFIFILNGSATLILKLFGMTPAKESEIYHSEEEIKLLLKESHAGGEISQNELTHINRAFAFDEMKLQDGYVAMADVAVINVQDSYDETKSYISKAHYTRFPVYKGEKVILSAIFMPKIYSKIMLLHSRQLPIQFLN